MIDSRELLDRSSRAGGTQIDPLGWFLPTVALIIAMSLALWAESASAAPRATTTATWYGPGFYGNAFACSAHPRVPNIYTRNVRGTAHMSLPCGTRVRICKSRRCVVVRVIDRGAFHPANLDLTARTAMDLCGCWKPYTMRVTWRRA